MPLDYLDRNSFLRSNLDSVAISIFSAIAARIAQSTARLLTTGKTPGYAKSITFVFELGSAPKCAGDGEKHFESVLTLRELQVL